jgi:diguanylate cyclase (GGDEF)-like protein
VLIKSFQLLFGFNKHWTYTKKFYNQSSIYFLPLLTTSLLVTFALVGIRQVGGLQSLELYAFDRMILWQAKAEPDDRLLVVEITESDIQKSKRWPLADATIAQLLEKLQQYRPKVIGIDVYRDIAQIPGEEALKKQLQAKNIVAIAKVGGVNDNVPPPPGVPPERIGFNNILLDPDNAVRRGLLYTESESEKYYSFALRLVLQFLEGRNLKFEVLPDSLKIGNKIFNPLQADSGGYSLPASEVAGWQSLLSYRSQETAKRVTLTDVLEGKINPNLIKDKIVLIGTTAPSIKDIFVTPLSIADRQESLLPGVLIHAQIVSQTLERVLGNKSEFWFWTQWQEVLWIWIWSILGIVLIWRSQHPLDIGIRLLIATVGLWEICLFLFTQFVWIPLVPATLAFIMTSGSVLAYKILYTTYHDALTGLPNRRLFTKKLKQLKKSKHRQSLLGVLCLDLDRFKLINDGLGYKAGDLLLISTSERLKAFLKPGDVLARVGADEFAIALNSANKEDEAIDLAKQLQQQLNLPFHLEEQQTFTTVSIGIAFDCASFKQPTDRLEKNSSPHDLLLDAYTAMYKAKVSGKNHHEVFVKKMHAQALTRLQLENDLRSAIVNREFELYYQPIICLKKLQIAGFEALVRWQSPSRGFVSPGDFIPVAEETGLIISLGQWILEQACQQMHLWQQKFSNYPPLMMSVNLSGRQFSQLDLVDRIAATIDEIGLDRRSLKLEITESMVMDDVEEAIAILDKLKQLDLRLSMDDFGTGFSSFSYLHRFPMDTLKVDRSFVSNMNESSKNCEIVSTIIMLAHKLGMDVVAEGIETEEQMKTLQSLECEYGQGYFFSKPLAKDNAEELLSRNPQW